MRQGFMSALCLSVLLASAPAFAADDAVDIMNPYKEEQKAVVDRSLETSKKYDDRWYEYVGERYKTTLKKPAETKNKDGSSVSEDEEAALKAAKALFKEFRTFQTDHDPEILGLYDDSARIVVTFEHQSGTKREQSYTMRKYADKLKQDMTLMSARDEKPVYSDVKYVPQGNGVKITATASYPSYRHTTPLVLVVKPDTETQADEPRWEIVEERYRQQM